VIILQVKVKGVAFGKTKRDAPVARYFHAPFTFAAAFERMQRRRVGMFLCPRGTAWADEHLVCPPYMVVATIATEEISVGGKCMEWIHYSYGGKKGTAKKVTGVELFL
jgi:hypothetical protein